MSWKLGFRDTSVWLMKHEIMQPLLTRERGRMQAGVIQMDAASLGGRRRGDKRGHGVRGSRQA